MLISQVHEDMAEEVQAQGPLTDKATGLRLRQNRGVARRYRQLKREQAEARNAATQPERRRSYRRQATTGKAA